MLDFLRKLQKGNRTSAESAAGPLVLAAFGKHPGWDDHIPGIGIETDALAQLKQSLYVGGIGGQLDAGAWKKLEADKRQEGFDHVFYWFRPGHALVGRFWSSSDGKGRKEYPMMLCVDGGPAPLESVLARSWPELERVREACQATPLAEEVRTACRLAQERLRTGADAASPRPAVSPEARTRFLNHSRFEPNGVGLLRVLHQLNSSASVKALGAGGRADASGLRSCHLRLPLAGDSPGEAILLWADFLKAAVSPTAPLLFLLRCGSDWCDVIVGEPTSDDLFCLQASPKALPLATEIPYALAPETSQRMRALTPKFLQEAAGGPTPRSGPPPAPEVGGGKARAGPGLGVWLGLGVCLIGGVLVAGYWFAGSRSHPEPVASSAIQASPVLRQQEQYEIAIRDGRAAYGRTNYAGALAQAKVALDLKHDDPTATKLRNDAEAGLAAASGKENDQKFQTAMQTGRAALAGADFAGAVAQAEAALGVKAGDPAALKLKNDAQSQMALAAHAKENDQKFQTAMQAGRAALAGSDYAGAVVEAETALGVKANDPAALKLKNDAQAQLALAAHAKENDQKFQAALQAGRAALAGSDFAGAVVQAEVALGVKANDAAALKLKNDAQTQLALAARAKESEQQFQTALQAARAALANADYNAAVVQAETALGIKANDAAALKLKSDAQTQLALVARAKESEQQFQTALQAGRAALANADYKGAVAQAETALGIKANDPAALKLKNDAQAQLALTARAKADEQKFQAAIQAGRAALARTNIAEALAQVDLALSLKANDSSAGRLRTEIQTKDAELKAAAKPVVPPATSTSTVASATVATPAAVPTPATPPPVALVAPSGGAVAGSFTNGLGMEFVRVEAGAAQGFWVGKYEVTQQQFSQLMGQLPDGQPATGDGFPVANVPIQDAREFCRRLGDKDGRTYRLPSRAEWLAVAGLPDQGLEQAWSGLIAQGILQHEVTSWHLSKLLDAPHPVGSLGAQKNQVCDLFGNVREWVIGDTGEVSAGFAYNSLRLSANGLFLPPNPDTPAIAANTGFRCVLVDNH